MVYEMYVDDGITIDEIDAVSGTLSVGKINSRIDGTNTRSIIHFNKNTIHHGFDDLDIDIKLKSKTDPQTTMLLFMVLQEFTLMYLYKFGIDYTIMIMILFSTKYRLI